MALLAVGLRTRKSVPARPEPRSSRAAAIINGLGNVGPAASFSMAGLLGFGGPKRLVLTFIAMDSVADAGLRNVVDVPLVVLYIAVSTSTVSVPVGIVVIAGERAAAILARGQSWLSEHVTELRKWLAIVIGAALVVDGAVRLLV
jgi:hypothetical protein